MKKILALFLLVSSCAFAGGPQTVVTFQDITGTVGIANGGTGQTASSAALGALGGLSAYTPVAIASGGTGATTAGAAVTALGAVGSTTFNTFVASTTKSLILSSSLIGSQVSAAAVPVQIATFTVANYWILAGEISLVRDSGTTGIYPFVISSNTSSATGSIGTMSAGSYSGGAPTFSIGATGIWLNCPAYTLNSVHLSKVDPSACVTLSSVFYR